MIDEKFTKWLVEEMEIRGVSRLTLARKTGLGISTIRRCVLWIGTPTLFAVGKILDFFGKEAKLVDKEVSE